MDGHNQIFLDRIVDMLKRHEGLRLNPYHCSANKLTIGIGRNLEDRGITESEAFYLLHGDINLVQEELTKNWGVWRTFPEKARLVCIDMTFQMGITGFMKFKETRKLMELGKWLEASEEVLRSRYSIQTPNRSLYNSRQLALCNKDGQKDK
nr:Phage-related lysozyme (muraminidase) (COG3772) [uncultured Mediterranean phage uvMED]BAR29349.1 Phage-related lysozyme (muraminidase) (COG3772) [uncultured Mediterranean phage uvMED]